jgi:hypothetical protein
MRPGFPNLAWRASLRRGERRLYLTGCLRPAPRVPHAAPHVAAGVLLARCGGLRRSRRARRRADAGGAGLGRLRRHPAGAGDAGSAADPARRCGMGAAPCGDQRPQCCELTSRNLGEPVKTGHLRCFADQQLRTSSSAARQLSNSISNPQHFAVVRSALDDVRNSLGSMSLIFKGWPDASCQDWRALFGSLRRLLRSRRC